MSTVNPFTVFHLWPDLVQIKLLESLSFRDCLKLRLVSRNWCTGVRYASHVWSVKKPSVRLHSKYLRIKMHDQFRYDSISTLFVNHFTTELNAWANPLYSQFRLPQFDKIVLRSGSNTDNIMEILTNNCKFVKSISLEECCLSEIKPHLLSDDLNLQYVQELEIDISFRQHPPPWLRVENQLFCLATLLTSNKFQFLRKLSFGIAMADYHARNTSPPYCLSQNAYDQFILAVDMFLKTHGAQIEELSVILDHHQPIIGIYHSFKYLKNVETFSFRFMGRSVPAALAGPWKNAISSFKKLTNITAYCVETRGTNGFEILLGTILKIGNISSLIIANAVHDLSWLYLYPCAHLKHFELEVYDSSLGDFENSSYKLESLTHLIVKFIVVTEDEGIWRNLLVNWITKIAPNIQGLVVKMHSKAGSELRFQQYNLNLHHVSELIHGLMVLRKLEVFCQSQGIPSKDEVSEFCKATDGHFFWTEFKLKLDRKDYGKEYVGTGFQLRIDRT